MTVQWKGGVSVWVCVASYHGHSCSCASIADHQLESMLGRLAEAAPKQRHLDVGLAANELDTALKAAHAQLAVV